MYYTRMAILYRWVDRYGDKRSCCVLPGDLMLVIVNAAGFKLMSIFLPNLLFLNCEAFVLQ